MKIEEINASLPITQIIELQPTPAQQANFLMQARAAKFVWNSLLTWHHQNTAAGIEFTRYSGSAYLTQLKKLPHNEWLKNLPASCTADVSSDLDKAFSASAQENRISEPRYKHHEISLASRRLSFGASWVCISSSFKSIQLVKCPGENSSVAIKLKKGQRIFGELSHHNCTIVYDGITQRWHLHISSKVPIWWLRKNRRFVQVINPDHVSGEDVGLTTFATGISGMGPATTQEAVPTASAAFYHVATEAVLTDSAAFHHVGTETYTVENPRFFREAEAQVASLNKKKSRKTKYSKRYNKISLRLAKVYRKTKNRRKQFHHDTANDALPKAGAHVNERLCVTGLKRMKNMGKSISDAGWSSYLDIKEQKAKRYGVEFYRAPKHFPSSKLCSTLGCGYKNTALKLKDREWICPECGVVHDREINAATNLQTLRVDDALHAQWLAKSRRKKSYGSFTAMHNSRKQTAMISDAHCVADTAQECVLLPVQVALNMNDIGAVDVSVSTESQGLDRYTPGCIDVLKPLSLKVSEPGRASL